MGEGFHLNAEFLGLHKTRLRPDGVETKQIGLLADLPASPEGPGDVYYATDTNTLYLTNLAGDTWVQAAGALSLNGLSDVDTTGYAKGSILVATSGSAWIDQPIGTNNQFLAADSGQTSGVNWRGLQASDIPTMIGDAGAGGTKGAVPAPASGDAAASKFLKADGTWASPSAVANIGCFLYKSATQSIADGVTAIISFNQESFDTDTMHDLVTNNTRITFNTAGRYMIGAHVQVTNAGIDEVFKVDINLGGVSGAVFQGYFHTKPWMGTQAGSAVIAIPYTFSVADYIELEVENQSDSSITIGGGFPTQTTFWAQKVA